MNARPSRVLLYSVVLTPLAYVGAVAATTWWYWSVYVPQINGED